MRSYKAEGIILKRSNFGEADRILTIFTRNHGKVKVIAKGVRRITSRRSPNIELFNLVTLYIHKGRALDILTEAQVENTFSDFRKNLKLVGLSYYICELIDSLCAENQAHPKVYELLFSALTYLNNISHLSDDGLRIIERFEKALLAELGFLPSKPALAVDTTSYIEQILERRIKTRRLLSRLV